MLSFTLLMRACSSFPVVTADLNCSLSAGPVSARGTYAQLAWNLISNPDRWHPALNQVLLLMSKIWQHGFGNDKKKPTKKKKINKSLDTQTKTPTWTLVFWLACHELWLQDKLAFYQHSYKEQCIISADVFPFILFNTLYQLLIYIHLVWRPHLEPLMSAALFLFLV